jgi:hypothetical protein
MTVAIFLQVVGLLVVFAMLAGLIAAAYMVAVSSGKVRDPLGPALTPAERAHGLRLVPRDEVGAKREQRAGNDAA